MKTARKKAREIAAHQVPGAVVESGWFDPRSPILIPLLLAIVARGLYWFLLPAAGEDAYITFRYAENWASGLGPVYNAGERVMGFSSPLWTAWLAVGAALTGKTLVWARLSSIALDLGSLTVGARILWREHGKLSAWIFAVFFALWPTLVAFSLLGMETSLFVFLLLAGAGSVATRGRFSGPLIGLLALTRPEATAAAVVLSLGARWRDRFVGLGVFAAGAGLLALYYGSPIPQSVLAKAATYTLTGLAGGRVWIDGLVPFRWGGAWPMQGEMQELFPLALVGTPAALSALWTIARRPGAARLVGAGAMAVLLGYALLGVPFFAWYVVVPIVGWAWLAAIGLPTISRHPALYFGLCLYVSTELYAMRTLYGGRNWAEEGFRGVGLWLKDSSGGKGTVFLEPIGHIGYVSGMRVIDEVGLVSPAVQRRRSHGAGWYADTVREARPDYLVVRPEFLDRNQAWAGRGAPFRSQEEKEETLSHYEHAFSGSSYELMPMRILKRVR